jgi:hypothetical protein
VRRSGQFVATTVALFCSLSFAAIGQEEPLPASRARQSAGETLSVDLPVEPIFAAQQPTLAEAARSNDYSTFDALYDDASRNEAAAYADLHHLWTYAVTDPIGAFYGEELHARLARAYPGYAAFIADYQIVDRNGNAFYPTAETRQFLLQYASSGNAPKMALARPSSSAPAPAVATRVIERAPKPRPARKVMQKADASRATPAVQVAVASPTTQTPAADAPVAAPKAAAPVQAQVVAKKAAPAPVQAQVIPGTSDTAVTGRGILLLILGLFGVGVLTLMMRTPQEDPVALNLSETKNVEPIRKPQESKKDAPRATGSHG